MKTNLKKIDWNFFEKSGDATKSVLKDKFGNLLLVFDSQFEEVTVYQSLFSWLTLFVNCESGKVSISDSLPLGSASSMPDWIDRNGAMNNVATTYVSGPFDTDISEHSILIGWKKIQAGGTTTIRKNRSGVFELIFNNDKYENKYESKNEGARNLLFKHLNNLDKKFNSEVSIEVSGGIDSGLIWSAANILGFGNKPIIEIHPYYEFKRENYYRSQLINSSIFSSNKFSIYGVCPFDGILNVPRHNEPNVNSTSWLQFHMHTEKASEAGSHALLSGHGGDVLFKYPANHPYNESEGENFNFSDIVIGKSNIDLCAHLQSDMKIKLNSRSIGAKNSIWDVRMLSPIWPTRFARNDLTMYQSGFLEPYFLSSLAHRWEIVGANKYQGKNFAREIFADLLPENIWDRPGKVDHAGVIARGLIRNEASLEFLRNKFGGVLSEIGIDVKKMPSLFPQKSYTKSSIKLISCYAAWLIWLNSIDRVDNYSIIDIDFC